MPTAAHVVDQVFQTQAVDPAFLEPESCLAVPQGKGVKVYSQSQGSTYDRNAIAKMLNIPREDVEVALTSSGGAFGAKEDLSVQGQTAIAAYLLGQPVKTTLLRTESARVHVKRHPMTIHMTAGCDAEGRLVALRVPHRGRCRRVLQHQRQVCAARGLPRRRPVPHSERGR